MRDYGQIQSLYWTDPDIQSLSDAAKLTGAYLLAGPHTTSLGCFRVPSGYIMEDLRHASETVTETISELLGIGFIKYDKQSQWLLIPKFLLWNPIANPNVAKKIVKDFNVVPEKVSFYNNLITCLKLYGKHFDNPFINHLETLSEQYRNKEPDPEPDPEPIQTPTKPGQESNPEPSSVEHVRPVTDSVHEIFEFWQTTMAHPKANLDDKRKKSISKWLKQKDGYTVEDLKNAITGCSLTPHNMGDNDRNEVYDDIGLILRDAAHIDRFIKNYENPPQPHRGQTNATNQQTHTSKPSLAERATQHREDFERSEQSGDGEFVGADNTPVRA